MAARGTGRAQGIGQLADLNAESPATEIDRRIRTLPERTAESIRRVRREYSKRLRAAPAEKLLALWPWRWWVGSVGSPTSCSTTIPVDWSVSTSSMWSDWAKRWTPGERLTPSAATSRGRRGGRGGCRMRSSTAGRRLSIGGGGAPPWSRPWPSMSCPQAGRAIPGAPWTSAGGWPRTATTCSSSRCRGRFASWWSGIPTRFGGSWKRPRTSSPPGYGGRSATSSKPGSKAPSALAMPPEATPWRDRDANTLRDAPKEARGRETGTRDTPGQRHPRMCALYLPVGLRPVSHASPASCPRQADRLVGGYAVGSLRRTSTRSTSAPSLWYGKWRAET
jgi:hypothetical protein